METYLDRYRQGAHTQVWQELVDQHAAIRQEPLLSEAQAVAREMMRRVRYNLTISARPDRAGVEPPWLATPSAASRPVTSRAVPLIRSAPVSSSITHHTLHITHHTSRFTFSASRMVS
jgi:hypothetical protein